jgi:mRNA-degrading endonuclease RelE of RelBE toxin-antitoxin system
VSRENAAAVAFSRCPKCSEIFGEPDKTTDKVGCVKPLSPLKQNVFAKIQEGIAQTIAGDIFYSRVGSAIERIKDIAEPPCGTAELSSPLSAAKPKRAVLPPISRVRAAFSPSAEPKRPPPWFVGLSKQFKKDIAQMDRTLMGRVFEALSELVDDPVKPKGDTIVPLQAELKGCWRYRIGAYRLIYLPDAKSGNITLLAFAGRGSIYEA